MSFLLICRFLGWCALVVSVRGRRKTNTSTSINHLFENDITVMVVTDVHSWVGGHGPQEPLLNINYGHVVSFYERLFQLAQQQENKDLFFVMNGDWIDGTGLSFDLLALTQILQQMPWDAINVGNHELYHAPLIEFITQPGGLVDWFGNKYLSSNIVRASSNQKPLGHRYVVLQGTNSAVLTFGFLYNMKDHVPSVQVEEIEAVVQEAWFIQALHNETYDAILVLAHMHVQDPLVQVLLQKIREQVGMTMPVQFITGHTHMRDYAVLDEWSASFEAGRYLDTIGLVSFPKANQSNTTNVTSHTFTHHFLDANQETLRAVLQVDSIDTPKGVALSQFIATVRDEMGLNQEMGCVNQSYYTTSALNDSSSLWGFFIKVVIPHVLPGKHALMLDKGDLRYDLLKGRVRLDDIIAVSPFNDTLYYWKDVPGSVILQLNESMNVQQDSSFLPLLPSYILAPSEAIVPSNLYELLTSEFEIPSIREALVAIFPKALQMEPKPTDLTATQLWLNYFREHSSCGIAHLEPTTPEHQDDPIKSNRTHAGEPESSKEDQMRLLFAGVAIGTILVLGTIHMRQRSRQFTKIMAAREAVMRDARNEFSDEESSSSKHRMEEESEGLFV
jgi:2',3'-cyclic-nucleotide 2'-phosphodiesterase (5'-nucleotidase family)